MIRKLVLALLFSLAFKSYSQVGQQLDYIRLNTGITVFNGTTGGTTDSVVVWNPTTGVFGMVNRSSFFGVVDSSLFVTTTHLNNAIVGKVNYSDSTITFVTPTGIIGKISYSDSSHYVTPTNLSTSLLSKLNIADSSKYITPTQRNSDTLTLHNEIATKGSGTVTSVGTGFGLSGGTITTTGTLKADTSASGVPSQYKLTNDSISIMGVVNGKGVGTITGVTAGLNLTGGGTSGTVTLNADTTSGNSKLATQGYVLNHSGSGTFVDTLYRTLGKDSIQFTIGGRYHAILDSLGSGGGGYQTFQQTITQGNTLTKQDTILQAGNFFKFSGGQLLSDTQRIGSFATYVPSKDMTVLGTSIEVGYLLTQVQNSYINMLGKALNLSVINYAAVGNTAARYSGALSDIPTASSTHKYLVLGSFGTNEVINGTDTGTTKTNIQALITNATGKGWSPSQIIMVSPGNINPNYGGAPNRSLQDNMWTMCHNLAVNDGLTYVDVYHTEIANYGNIPNYDSYVHPSYDGHSLIYKKAMNVLNYQNENNGQQLAINGLTQLSTTNITINDTIVPANQTNPLVLDVVRGKIVQQTPNYYIRNIDTLGFSGGTLVDSSQFASINISRNLQAGNIISGTLLINGNGGFLNNVFPYKGLNFSTNSNVAYISNYSAGNTIGNIVIGGGGKVAIGNGTPTSTLHVFGSGNVTNILNVGSSIQIGTGGISGTGFEFGVYNNVTGLITNAYGSGNITTNYTQGNLSVGTLTPPSASTKFFVNAPTGGVLLAPHSQSSIVGITSPRYGLLAFSTDSAKFQVYDSLRSSWFEIPKCTTATAILDFPSTAAGASSDLTITVTGASVGDVVDLGVDNASVVANSQYTAWVSSTNTVTVRFGNLQLVSAIDPPSGTFKVKVFK